MAACDSGSDLKRKSDRFVKTGEEMLDVLAHDINRYDLLAEEVASETVLNEILSQWDGNSVSVNDVNRTLNENVAENGGDIDMIEAEKETTTTSTNNRFVDISEEDTNSFLELNKNNNTKSKTRSDLKIFHEWSASNDDFRDIKDIPQSELDTILARFFLSK